MITEEKKNRADFVEYFLLRILKKYAIIIIKFDGAKICVVGFGSVVWALDQLFKVRQFKSCSP